MWVEISVTWFRQTIRKSHPLREDVSWNTTHIRHSKKVTAVILFVRMWVEMIKYYGGGCGQIRHPLREDVSWNSPSASDSSRWPESSSSWGCELKFKTDDGEQPGNESSSSWGCELKWQKSLQLTWKSCHPLREDVSWNNSGGGDVFAGLASSSSWGCELKFLISSSESCQSPSSSSWGYELKWISLCKEVVKPHVILFVKMWVEMLMI